VLKTELSTFQKKNPEKSGRKSKTFQKGQNPAIITVTEEVSNAKPLEDDKEDRWKTPDDKSFGGISLTSTARTIPLAVTCYPFLLRKV